MLRSMLSSTNGSVFDLDLLVLGSGAAAFAAAIRARDLGRSVALVERATLGGTCVNVGCIPSKSLLHDAASAAGDRGLWAAAVERKDGLVLGLRRSKYADLLAEYGIELHVGDARLTGAHTVAVDGREIRAGAVLLAVGARPTVPQVPGLATSGLLTSTTAMELPEAPRRLAVIGAGSVGLELADVFAGFGSEVTLIARSEVASAHEPEVRQALRARYARSGRTLLEHATVDRVQVDAGERVLSGAAGGERFELRADAVLVAVGRTPNTDELGLDAAGVKVDAAGFVLVDEHQRTSTPWVFAAGDCTPQPEYVYVAAAAGAAAASNALGDEPRSLDFAALPRVIFTSPQLAVAGLTERAALAAGHEVETAVLGLDAVPRALVDGATDGVVKLVVEAGTRRLLGASVLADGAGEVIAAAVLAIERGMTAGELAASWAPYLTMAESPKLAAQSFDRDPAHMSCCAA